MKYKVLRWLRIIAALIVLAGFLALFTLPAPWNQKAASLTDTQYMPAIVNTIIWGAFGAYGPILILTLLTAVAGRMYCSWLCPLGILQDAVDFIKRKVFRRKPNGAYRKSSKILQMAVFAVLMILYLTGWALPLGLLEPYSFFGRISGNIFRHINSAVNAVTLQLPFDAAPLNPNQWALSAFALGLLLGLTALVLFGRRIYCNTICPAGTVLAAITANSGKMLIVDPEKCVSCGKCEKLCKSSCIDIKNKVIDFERCVMCMDCAAACPVSAIKFVGRKRYLKAHPDHPHPAMPDRRQALLTIGAAGAAAVAVGKTLSAKASPAAEAILPPGAGNVKDFLARCTGCGLCIANCRGGCLQPAKNEYGWQGWSLPVMRFAGKDAGKCEYECSNCTRLCPTGALQHLSLQQKKLRRLGLAYFYPALCIANVDGEPCGACAEHCPTGALKMVNGPKGATIPQVITDLCIGCGNCQFACPVRPEAAIRIRAVDQQTQAVDPAEYRAKEAKPQPPSAIPF